MALNRLLRTVPIIRSGGLFHSLINSPVFGKLGGPTLELSFSRLSISSHSPCTNRSPMMPCFDQLVRHSTIFTSLPADQIWEGVTGPRGGTKKRARGKRRVTRPKIDLHRGQRLGVGKGTMQWPGLNVPLLSRTSVRNIEKGEYNEAYFKRLEELRNKSAVKRKRTKLAPLERGWTGSRLAGQSIGPPSPDHPDFDTRVIEMKVVATMTATVGRYRRFSVLVATGNGQGLCGLGKARAITLHAAMRRAKSRAAQSIVSFDLKDQRTLWHIGHVSEWHSKIFAKPMPEGTGLVCHRLIKTLCQVIGIKDMYAKVEGSTGNYLVIARGFLRLLSEQESYNDLANRLGLHVVEFSSDRDMYPQVLASPSSGKSIDIRTLRLDNKSSSSSSSSTGPQQSDPNKPLPILAISHPERHRPRRPRFDDHESFLDDLVEIGEGDAIPTDARELLIAGERDLDAIALGGRVPYIKKRPAPGYLQCPGNLKRARERYRYRNHEDARRQRQVYEFLDQMAA